MNFEVINKSQYAPTAMMIDSLSHHPFQSLAGSKYCKNKKPNERNKTNFIAD